MRGRGEDDKNAEEGSGKEGRDTVRLGLRKGRPEEKRKGKESKPKKGKGIAI